MATNEIPKSFSQLVHLAKECQDGATAIGASIPLVLNASGTFGSVRGNALQVQGEYQSALAALPPLRAALETARADAVGWVFKARDWLRNFLGREWSQAWRAAGFENASLGVPREEAALSTLLERLQMYFGNHTAHENAAQLITGARASALLTALNTARANVNTKWQECGTRKAARDAAVRALEARLRSLISELRHAIGREDPRWRQFGLNVPAAPVTPGVPQNMAATSSVPGELTVSCDAVPNATHYRFFTQRPGIDLEPLFVGRAEAPWLHLAGLPVGTSYEVYVTAANAGAESRFSAPATVVVSGALAQAA